MVVEQFASLIVHAGLAEVGDQAELRYGEGGLCVLLDRQDGHARERFIRQRITLITAIRAHLAEHRIAASAGRYRNGQSVNEIGGLAGGPGFQVARFIQLNQMLAKYVDRNVPQFG